MTTLIISFLLFFAIGFALVGLIYARRQSGSFEDYIVARNSQSTLATTLTLMATSLGAWILFAPAQAATWGGLAAVVGYALGALMPRLLMIPLGSRMRALIPQGHTLSEYVLARYGRGMYALCLLIMLFYMFIAITAEVTAIAKLVTLLAPIPLWVTASIVLLATVVYTFYGGLRASIFTDQVQIFIIIPLLLALCVFGWQATGGLSQVWAQVQWQQPDLLDLKNITGVKAGLTFLLALLLTGLFHQGNWQRVYAARSNKAMRHGFLWAGVLVMPVVFVMGLFGLAFVGTQAGGDSSVAVFSVVMPHLPIWFVILLLPLGLALVMSSADTALNAVSSLIAVDMRRLWPQATASTLMRWSRLLLLPFAVLIGLFAAKGYSVLYLFLLADLLCCAAAFPVFVGLFSRQYHGTIAVVSTLAGLVAGLVYFPAPGQEAAYLLESFLLAIFLPVVVSVVWWCVGPKGKAYNLEQLRHLIQGLDKAHK